MVCDERESSTSKGLIDLHDSASVELWCAALRVTTAELVDIVNKVGNDGERVAEFIREDRLSRYTRSQSQS
jgi:hypothetical protein